MNIRKEIAIRELEEKAKMQRLKWFAENYDKIYKDQSSGHPEKEAKKAAMLYNELKKIQKEIVEFDKFSRPKKKEIPKREPIKYDKADILRPIMYPVPQPYLDVLFGSGLEQGYKMYLKLRSRYAPYERYYEPQTYNMDYGWKIEERGERVSKEFARYEVIKPQFYRRCGVKGETLRNRPPFASGILMCEVL